MGCRPVRQGTAAGGPPALPGQRRTWPVGVGSGGRAWPLLPEEGADDHREFGGGESAGARGMKWVPDALGLVSLLLGA
ncbi:hypothetical protein CJD44_14180 [Streptomyces sp. alain-838]|nr:hypothetical protein CJD44_14180 [Streptomyces sp. alain-838]